MKPGLWSTTCRRLGLRGETLTLVLLAIAVVATVAFRLAARIWPGVDHRATITAINAGRTSKRRTTSIKIVKPNRRR